MKSQTINQAIKLLHSKTKESRSVKFPKAKSKSLFHFSSILKVLQKTTQKKMKFAILFCLFAVFTYHTLGLPLNSTNAEFISNSILTSNNITNSSVILNIMIGINGEQVPVVTAHALTGEELQELKLVKSSDWN